jgi:type IV pilus assembly protein PilM
MSRRRIGVDIGSTAVRAAEVSMNGSPVLTRVAQTPVPAGAVQNGEVRDPRAVADALKELWQRGKFKGRDVILGVGNQRVVVREVSLPWLEEKELRQSLRFQVQEYVPIPVDEAVLDYQVIDEFEQEGRRMVRLLLVAAQQVMIQQIVQAAEMARLKPVGLDLIPFAIVRSAGSSRGMFGEGEEGVDEAVIDVGAEVTSICVHSAGLPRFVRILPSGGKDVTSAIARTMGIPEDEAESLKRNGAAMHHEPHEADGHDPVGVRQAAMSRVDAFVSDIRSSLDFYLGQMPGTRIGRVLYTGGGSKLNGFGELLEERLPADVEVGRPFHRVKTAIKMPEEMMAEAEPLLAVAIGLALPGDRG